MGYDILAAAGIYNQQMGDVNVTVGAYGFPYLHQNNIFSDGRCLLVGMLTALRFIPVFSFLRLRAGASHTKFKMFGGGELDYSSRRVHGRCPELEFDYAFDMVGRLELYPSMMAQVSTIGVEGWLGAG